MVDKDYIFRLLHNLFKVSGSYDIDEITGVVTVQGDVELTKPRTQMPKLFGKVTGVFSCANKGLTTLQGAPQEVGSSFNCLYNQLTDLQGAPLHVGGDFYCASNPLTTFNGMPETIKGSFVGPYGKHLPLLRTLNCQDRIQLISATEELTPEIVPQILNRHTGKGRASALKAAGELIRAGYKENARW